MIVFPFNPGYLGFGTSLETKPTWVDGSSFTEIDTGRSYYRSAGVWVLALPIVDSFDFFGMCNPYGSLDIVGVSNDSPYQSDLPYGRK